MSLSDFFSRVVAWVLSRPAWFMSRPEWYMGLPIHKKFFWALIATMVVVEFGVGKIWPKSAFYKKWQHGVEAVGSVWTAVILSIVYALSVGPISLFMKLFGKDPLDRRVEKGRSAWHAHEPNPLGALAAARHQF